MAATGVHAQAPANDAWAAAELITALPFADVEGAVRQATLAGDDPYPVCAERRRHTLWYRYVTGPAPQYLTIQTTGSSYDTVVSVFKGEPGAFVETMEGCNDDGAAPTLADVKGVRLEAESSYSILVASFDTLPADVSLHLQVAAALVHSVTKTEDSFDGACDADCSLREAIAAQNAQPGVVVVPPGTYALTRAGAGEDANATGDLDLSGAGAVYGAGGELSVIDAQGLDRAVELFDTPSVNETRALVGLGVRAGAATDGGALYLRGGFFGVLRALNVSDSAATNAGGGLHSTGNAFVTDCRFSRNSAPKGGGLYQSTSGLLYLESSTFDENTASETAGGADLRARFNQLYNVTFSHNQGVKGGGLYLDMLQIDIFTGETYFSNASFVGNSATFGAGLHLRAGVIFLNNSLFAANTISAPDMGVDCHDEGTMGNHVTGVYNLFESFHPLRCAFVPMMTEGNLYNVDARVSPVLAQNGGTTPTHALLPGSLAIDSAEPTCRMRDWADNWFLGPARDQRGRSRATDGNGDGIGHCDRGAYERTRVKGDFDSDRGTDLLLRNLAAHSYSAWLMNGTTRLLEAAVTPTPVADLRVQALDDFTGDERDDLVLRSQASGTVEFWRLGGANGLERQGDPLPIGNAPTLDASWILAASADFDRDGRADLLWRNALSQKLAVWTMAGTNRLGTLTPSPDQAVHANWSVVGALDLDGNGTSDLLWYNATTGKIVQWLMDDAVVRTAGRFTTPPSAGNNNWKVVAGGDYGRGPRGLPGTADMVWRNETSGKLVIWHLEGSGTRTAGVFTNPDQPEPPLAWEVAGPR